MSANMDLSSHSAMIGKWLELTIPVDDHEYHGILPEHMFPFWGTYIWASNPWISELRAMELLSRKYDRIPVMAIQDLQIKRITSSTFAWQVVDVQGLSHTRVKLGRWLSAIVLASPRIEIGHCIGDQPCISLCRGPKQLEGFRWALIGPDKAKGIRVDNEETLVAHQQPDGIFWKIVSGCHIENDIETDLQQIPIVFRPHPDLHLIGWSIDDSTPLWKIWYQIRRSFRMLYVKGVAPELGTILSKWKIRCEQNQWWASLQDIEPKQVWEHDNVLTDYQVWVMYRTVTMQLNTFYMRGTTSRKCLLDERCSGLTSDTFHIFWECKRARSFLTRLLRHWLGIAISGDQLPGYMDAVIKKDAPQIRRHIEETMMSRHGWYDTSYFFDRIWKGVCRVATAWLWQLRNQVVFQGKIKNAYEHLEFIWKQCRSQLKSVLAFERRSVSTREDDIRLQISL